MNLFFSVGWTSLIVFFALGLIGLWVAFSFLNKNGLYLFCILTSAIVSYSSSANLFSHSISISTVLTPIIIFAIIACFNKYGKKEAVKLFLVTIISQIVLFIVALLQGVYIDAFVQTKLFMSWRILGGYFANILSIAFACFGVMIFQEKVSLKKLNTSLQTACLIAVACAIENLIFTIITYAGLLSFGNILLVFLIKLLITVLLAIILGFFEKYLNRQLSFKVVKTEKENKKENEIKNDKQQTEIIKEENKEPAKNEKSLEENSEEINYDNSAD